MSFTSDPPFSLYSPHSPTIPLLSPPPGSSLWTPLDILRSYCIRGVPGWSTLSPANIRLTQMKKGMTNQLFIAERVMGGGGGGEYVKVVVRVFGADTSTFFDREYEEYITRRLSKRGVGSRILTEFGSGRIECFLEGRTLECDDLSDPRISFLAAQALATLHSKHIPITAHLIDTAKKKVQKDAAKLLPLHSDGGVGGGGAGSAVQVNGSAPPSSTSPPSSPSHSFSSLSPTEVASVSQPTSPVQVAVEASSSAHLPLPVPPSFAFSSSAPPSAASDADDGVLDSVGYQEPLLYFRIHHWYNVARRLHFPGVEPANGRAEDSSGELTDSLDSFHLSSPLSFAPSRAASKRRLFLSLDLNGARVEAEERWLLRHLQSLHSPIVFCHNDLQEGNLILEEKQPRDRRRRRARKANLNPEPSSPHLHSNGRPRPSPTPPPPPPRSLVKEVVQADDGAAHPLQRLHASRERALSLPGGAAPISSSLVIDVTGSHRRSGGSSVAVLVPYVPAEEAACSLSPSIGYEELHRLMNSPHSPSSPEQRREAFPSVDGRPSPPLPSPTQSPRSPFPSSSSSPYSGWRLHMIDFEVSCIHLCSSTPSAPCLTSPHCSPLHCCLRSIRRIIPAASIWVTTCASTTSTTRTRSGRASSSSLTSSPATTTSAASSASTCRTTGACPRQRRRRSLRRTSTSL